MPSHDGRFYITFNGEIYNYKDLRSGLVKQGHKFITQSDTEVILELYRAYGWQGFEKLRGMFAFALWDLQKQEGVLVRDPLGIKPLFIQHEADSLNFASEAKALLAKNNDTGQLNPTALHLLMNFRYLPGEHSLFQGITQLAPGRVIQWNSSGKAEEQRLQPNFTVSTPPLDTLRDSIQAHFTADVEVGAYLSGGIDSACVVALGKEMTPQPLRTFTLRAGDDPNEAVYAAQTSEILGVQNIQGEINCSLATELPQMVWHLETPKINALQVGLLAQLTSRHVKVALSGLGGDELFYGYNAHKVMLKAQQINHLIPNTLSHSAGKIGSHILASLNKPIWTESERALQMLQHLGDWSLVYGLLRNIWDQPKMRPLIYGPRMLDQQLPNAFGEIENHWPDNADPLTAMAQFEFKNKMVNDLLWQEDRMSMAAGLEVRVPFVDYVFASQIQRMDRSELMPNNQLKGYMRTMLAGTLPTEILNRPKSGFQVSSPDFFHLHLKPLAENYLSKDRIIKYGLFNPAFVAQVLHLTPSIRLRWHYFILYLMLLTHIWIDLFELKGEHMRKPIKL